MSTVAQQVEPEAFDASNWAPPLENLYRMSVAKYEALVASGVFTKQDRFELLNGYLVKKMTQSPPHAAACDGISRSLQSLLPGGWYVRNDRPLNIASRSSEPEPDLSIVRGTWRNYETRHPEPADVALVVEVADSSLRDDRTIMAQSYGSGGVPVYWIVNLVDRQVEVHEGPCSEGYARREVYREGTSVPVAVDGQEMGRLEVSEVLPKRKEEK